MNDTLNKQEGLINLKRDSEIAFYRVTGDYPIKIQEVMKDIGEEKPMDYSYKINGVTSLVDFRTNTCAVYSQQKDKEDKDVVVLYGDDINGLVNLLLGKVEKNNLNLGLEYLK